MDCTDPAGRRGWVVAVMRRSFREGKGIIGLRERMCGEAARTEGHLRSSRET